MPASTPTPEAVEARVNDLLGKLTADEKLALIGGDKSFFIREIPRLGLPAVKMADGPLGVRNYGPSTAYPATIALAASWDTALAQSFGESLARDARARGVHIILAPAVNINRVPQNGRNFEYLTEDPLLASAFAVSIIDGIQSQGVVATVKHFAANNQETERMSINVVVDERTLREIYLPAFKAAVQVGHVWAVMDAYNKLNGDWCTANEWLNNTVLKKEWGFPGVLMSDWGAAHDTLKDANAGLDLEMPGGRYMNATTLQPFLASGQVTQATIDDKVRRILRLEVANGFLDREQTLALPKDNPASAAVAEEVASEGTVLLKNEGNLLPLDVSTLKSVVLVGPAASNYFSGGGSSKVKPFHAVTLADGLTKLLPSTVKVTTIPGPNSALLDQLAATSTYHGPLKLQFFQDWNNSQLLATLSDDKVDHDWGEALPAPGTKHHFFGRWTGEIKADTAGTYLFMTRAYGAVHVYIDNKEIMEDWGAEGGTIYAQEDFAAGSVHQVSVEYLHRVDSAKAYVRFGWGKAPAALTPDDEAAIKAADVTIISVGFGALKESEGSDRPFDLPKDQTDLVKQVTGLTAHAVVVLQTGGAVATKDWLGSVPALVQAWYPGQAGGTALAALLAGDVSPSGKLPASFAKSWEDYAAYPLYPGKNGTTAYTDGILVGYRWFDAKGVEPLYPFGFGLSYTTFKYSDLQVVPTGPNRWEARFKVTNTGERVGDEIAQLYIQPGQAKVVRPPRELKGFSRLSLKPGETKTAIVPLDLAAFSYFSEASHGWVAEPGLYQVKVGGSSRDLPLTFPVTIP